MTAVIEHSFSQIITSDPDALGSEATVSSDGSRVDIGLDEPLRFSGSSVVTSVEISIASIFNSSPNISVAKNNNTLTYLIGGVVQPVITIPDGLYSITTLNAEIVRNIVNDGNPSNTLTLAGNNSTGKSIFTFATGVQVDMAASTVRSVLGFDPGTYPAVPPVVDGTSVDGQNIAAFADTLDFVIKSNVVPNSIPLNNRGLNIIGIIPITAPVGNVVNYQPYNPLRVGQNQLRGKTISDFYVQICDSAGVGLPQTEFWSVTLTFRQTVVISDKEMPLIDIF
jgi:hypothetical protein